MQRAGYLLPATVTGALWLKGLHPGIPGLGCPLRALTGVPCPTCFLTRATSAALTGDLGGSLQWHLFGPIAALGMVFWSVLALQQRRLIPQRSSPLAPAVGGWRVDQLLAAAPEHQQLAQRLSDQRNSPR